MQTKFPLPFLMTASGLGNEIRVSRNAETKLSFFKKQVASQSVAGEPGKPAYKPTRSAILSSAVHPGVNT